MLEIEPRGFEYGRRNGQLHSPTRDNLGSPGKRVYPGIVYPGIAGENMSGGIVEHENFKEKDQIHNCLTEVKFI